MRKILFFLSLFQIGWGEDGIFWWEPFGYNNFGDYLAKVIVERIIDRPVQKKPLETTKTKLLLSVGSVLHYAREGDVVWGSGFRDNPMIENRFQTLDIRAVRGPLTRKFLLMKGIDCPQVYGDPAVLMARLFPEFRTEEKLYDYIIIPAWNDLSNFKEYKNVVSPIEPWDEIVKKIVRSKIVISSSLHGLIVAESYGIPARLLKMSWDEPLLKYQDYYLSTGRPDFRYANSVLDALEMGGESPPVIDLDALLQSFPYDYFN